MNKSERSLRFKENYLEEREKNKSVVQIADEYSISHRYAYGLIHELADEMGVPYESLIQKPHPTHPSRRNAPSKLAKIDLSKFQKEFRSTISAMDKMNNQMKAIFDKLESIESDEKEESV